MLRLKFIVVAALAATLSGCMSDGNGLDAGFGGGLESLGNQIVLPTPRSLGLGGLGTSSLPNTDAYVKAQLERRGI